MYVNPELYLLHLISFNPQTYMESKATHFINREGLTCPRTQVINREKFRNLQVQLLSNKKCSLPVNSKEFINKHSISLPLRRG